MLDMNWKGKINRSINEFYRLEIKHAFMYIGTYNTNKDPWQLEAIRDKSDKRTISPGEVYNLDKYIYNRENDLEIKISSTLILVKSVLNIDSDIGTSYKSTIKYIDLNDNFAEKTFEISEEDFIFRRVSIHGEYYGRPFDNYRILLCDYIPYWISVDNALAHEKKEEAKETEDCPLYRHYAIWNQDDKLMSRYLMKLRNYQIEYLKDEVEDEDKLPMVAYSIYGCNILVGHSDDIKESYEELKDLEDPFFDVLVDCDKNIEDRYMFINKSPWYKAKQINQMRLAGAIALYHYNEKCENSIKNCSLFRISDCMYKIISISDSKVKFEYAVIGVGCENNISTRELDIEILGSF